MKKRVVILSNQSGDWEGLFIDGKLIDEGHILGEGNSKIYLMEQSELFNFRLKDVLYEEVNDADEEKWMENFGGFPKTLDE